MTDTRRQNRYSQSVAANFVAAYDDDDDNAALLPPVPPAHAVQVLPPAHTAPDEVLSHSSLRAIEKTSPLLQAQAFMLKYAGLSLVMLILAIGLTWYVAAPAPVAILLFGVLAFAGYWLLGFMEAQFTTAGVERHRLTQGARVISKQIDAQREIELQKVALQREIVTAQTEYNRQQHERMQQRIAAQLQQHEQPQSQRNAQHNYVPPDSLPDSADSAVLPPVSTDTGHWQRVDLEVPPFLQRQQQLRVRDEARRTLCEFVASLYELDAAGAYVKLYDDGRVRRDVRTPMSARSGLSQPVREQIMGILDELARCGVWLLRYDEQQRLYRLNVAHYPTPDVAVDAINDVPTLATWQ